MDEESLKLKQAVEDNFYLLLKSLEDCGPTMYALNLKEADVCRLVYLLISNNQ